MTLRPSTELAMHRAREEVAEYAAIGVRAEAHPCSRIDGVSVLPSNVSGFARVYRLGDSRPVAYVYAWTDEKTGSRR